HQIAMLIQVICDQEADYAADAAAQHEADETFEPLPTAQPPVAIGQKVIEREVEDHRESDRHCIGGHECLVLLYHEASRQHSHRDGQDRHIHNNTQSAHDEERQEPDRYEL